MLTTEQLKQVDYNNNALKNYKRNKAIQISIEQRESKQRLRRRKELEKEIRQRRLKEPVKFRLHDRTVINRSELTEAMIESELEFWFLNYKQ